LSRLLARPIVHLRVSALVFCLSLSIGASSAAIAQDGLRFPSRPGAGIDPTFAPGWLSPQSSFADARFGFAQTQRRLWSYSLSERSSLGLSYSGLRDLEPTAFPVERQYGLFGRYSLAPDWSLSAETLSREPGNLLRLQDLRIGIRRQF
jgi:hypothetical protein